MRLFAPAKINLHLRVGPAREDGFHPLMTWMATVGLFDTLTIEGNEDEGIGFSCSDPSLPTNERNVVVRAANVISRTRGPAVHPRGIKIHLEKRIPSQAGLGGGSSDAATTLLGLNELLNLRLTPAQLLEHAAQLGSDVPFFLFGASSVCTGRGEIVRPISRPAAQAAVLFLPEIEISTARVYQIFDHLRLGKTDAVSHEPGWNNWAAVRAEELLPQLANDLEAAAFELSPPLAKLRSALQQELGRIVRMSGSGSTLFTLFDDLAGARAAAEVVSSRQCRAIAVPIAPSIADDAQHFAGHRV